MHWCTTYLFAIVFVQLIIILWIPFMFIAYRELGFLISPADIDLIR